MIDILLFAIYGTIAGVAGGYAGIGGAPFIIIGLTLFSHFSQHLAQGTSLAVMLGPMSLLSVIHLRHRIKPFLKHIIYGTIAYAFSSYIGAYLAYLLPSVKLQKSFAIFLVFIGFLSILKNIIHSHSEHKENCSALTIGILGFFIGIVGGFFGIGAGVLFVPIMTNILKLHKDIARGISLSILLPPVSLGGVIKYGQNGDINILAAVIIFISYFLTNYIGSKIGHYHSHKKFSLILNIILIITGISVYFYSH